MIPTADTEAARNMESNGRIRSKGKEWRTYSEKEMKRAKRLPDYRPIAPENKFCLTY